MDPQKDAKSLYRKGAMKGRMFLLSLIILISGCQRKSPTKPGICIEGIWREDFKQVYQSLIGDPPFFVSPTEAISYASTLTLENTRYQILLNPPMPQGYYREPGQYIRASWEGAYALSGDTIRFIDVESKIIDQQYRFEIWSDSLKLSFVPLGYSPGDSIVCIPLGGLPWGNAWGRLSGTFHRINSEGRE